MLRLRVSLCVMGMSLAGVACSDDGPEPLVPQEDCTTISYDDFGSEFVDEYCIMCHTSAASWPDGKADDYDLNTVEDIREHGRAIRGHVLQGDGPVMPPAGLPQPTAEELDQLSEWLDCGAPN